MAIGKSELYRLSQEERRVRFTTRHGEYVGRIERIFDQSFSIDTGNNVILILADEVDKFQVLG